jgi:hypothetical protein
MIIKIVILAMLALMIYNLFRAMLTMNKNDPNKPTMSKYIGRRVITSIALVVLLVLGVVTGVITPNPHP